MRVLMINSVCGIRSTGRICTNQAQKLISEGHEVKIAYGREEVPPEYQAMAIRIGTKKDIYINALKSRLLDNEGFNCKKSTINFLKWAEAYNPDSLWLHNLHGYYINLELLFSWIKSRPNMEVRWTLHDCWAFTGHCAHFSYIKCYSWKKKCDNCQQKHEYPYSLYKDNSKNNYLKKKNVLSGVPNMTLIVPSYWLANLIKDSFLKDYPIEIVHNTIDTTVFKPTESNFRERHNLLYKKVILGVASAWGERKGILDFIKLSELMDESYQIVLVGLTDKQIQKIPKKILCIPRTNSIKELAEIYSAADVFVNPSKEETFGLTTIEALSCGTPAIVYEDTACEEVAREYGGIVVEQSVYAIIDAIEELKEEYKYENCVFD